MFNTGIPYLMNAVSRKTLAFLNEHVVKPSPDQDLINLIQNCSTPSNPNPIDEYLSLQFWKNSDQYAKKLKFKDGIAVAEKSQASSPLTPALYALLLYNDMLGLEDPVKEQSFWRHVEYLDSIAKNSELGTYWEHKENIPRFELKGSWTSGITQGAVASLFIRAYKLSNDLQYKHTALSAISYSTNPMSPLFTDYDNGMFWIEEYPAAKGSGVLNGYLFILIAMGELASIGEKTVPLAAGMQSLFDKLPALQFKKRLKYALSLPEYSNIFYETLHTCQLNHLSKLFPNSIFHSIHELWSKNVNWDLAIKYFGKDQVLLDEYLSNNS